LRGRLHKALRFAKATSSTDYADYTDFFQHQVHPNNLYNLRSKPTTSCFFSKIFGPGGTKVNSRGRAALREAHGSMKQGLKTLKGVRQ
jgi:hypothetical protein